ncbi:hypothetical protein [uncultured Amnibacterium sp.]|uniref:hypothetical protein n=1 Tax=uncultured Amnibacterium sp. TaxID=1631851 RepID=UPI0035CB569C
MAEVNDPAGEPPAENDRRVARPAAETGYGREQPPLLVPPTDDELADRGEPSADEVHAAAGRSEQPVDPATRRLDSVPPDPVEEPEARQDDAPQRPVAARAATPVTDEPQPRSDERDPATAPDAERVGAERAEAEPAAVPVAPTAATPIEPAAADAPPPPKVRGNRIVGFFWVMLAAGIFQVLFFAANALVALVFGGTAAVVPQLQSIAGTALAWLPVLLLFLLFLLTVLISGRAGRVAYVFSSLLVGAAVYIGTVLLFSLIVRHALGDANTLAQTFLNWEFILIGLVARETMLWTGLAIGSRGIRVRRRNRDERKRYEEGLADARS